MSAKRHLHFVTGRLAESSLRRVVEPLAASYGFDYIIDVMPITVAALMTPTWIAKRLRVAPDVTAVVLPGYCAGDLACLREVVSVPIEVGPRDLRALPEYLGHEGPAVSDYGARAIEIIAEINFAPRLSEHELLAVARRMAQDGADVIDLGCEPGQHWTSVGDAVRRLRDAGLRVSIDSFNCHEIASATAAGAELVLSVNASNRDAAADWGAEVVAIPETPDDLSSLDQTANYLEQRNVPYRLDPILEPIGFGFAASLRRYATVRERYPNTPMMMGIGNLTELTDVDSAGVNVMLMAICEEWQIRSVLTTQVINWARSSVRECDLAGRLVRYAVHHHTLPKHVDGRLIALRDERVYEQGEHALNELADTVRDPNYRIFAEGGKLHLVSAGLHLSDVDAFDLFARLMRTGPKNVDASHAFYLGFELAKAVTALTLDKQYNQDQALNWGHLTVEERIHRAKREAVASDSCAEKPDADADLEP